ncbi:MAG TPA: hypothetical protein DEA44_10210 [Firmicutes bacterium]|nr:hypothetical protein [Bacillota bacterium]
MLDGLWLIQFHSPCKNDTRSGVVLFQGSELVGGDSSYYYVGSCENTDKDILLKMRLRKHSPGVSVFGHLMDFNLILSGKFAANTLLLEGLPEHREHRLQVKLSRLQ